MMFRGGCRPWWFTVSPIVGASCRVASFLKEKAVGNLSHSKTAWWRGTEQKLCQHLSIANGIPSKEQKYETRKILESYPVIASLGHFPVKEHMLIPSFFSYTIYYHRLY